MLSFHFCCQLIVGAVLVSPLKPAFGRQRPRESPTIAKSHCGILKSRGSEPLDRDKSQALLWSGGSAILRPSPKARCRHVMEARSEGSDKLSLKRQTV